jgi:hypothetical protein
VGRRHRAYGYGSSRGSDYTRAALRAPSTTVLLGLLWIVLTVVVAFALL